MAQPSLTLLSFLLNSPSDVSSCVLRCLDIHSLAAFRVTSRRCFGLADSAGATNWITNQLLHPVSSASTPLQRAYLYKLASSMAAVVNDKDRGKALLVSIAWVNMRKALCVACETRSTSSSAAAVEKPAAAESHRWPQGLARVSSLLTIKARAPAFAAFVHATSELFTCILSYYGADAHAAAAAPTVTAESSRALASRADAGTTDAAATSNATGRPAVMAWMQSWLAAYRRMVEGTATSAAASHHHVACIALAARALVGMGFLKRPEALAVLETLRLHNQQTLGHRGSTAPNEDGPAFADIGAYEAFEVDGSTTFFHILQGMVHEAEWYLHVDAAERTATLHAGWAAEEARVQRSKVSGPTVVASQQHPIIKDFASVGSDGEGNAGSHCASSSLLDLTDQDLHYDHIIASGEHGDADGGGMVVSARFNLFTDAHRASQAVQARERAEVHSQRSSASGGAGVNNANTLTGSASRRVPVLSGFAAAMARSRSSRSVSSTGSGDSNASDGSSSGGRISTGFRSRRNDDGGWHARDAAGSGGNRDDTRSRASSSSSAAAASSARSSASSQDFVTAPPSPSQVNVHWQSTGYALSNKSSSRSAEGSGTCVDGSESKYRSYSRAGSQRVLRRHEAEEETEDELGGDGSSEMRMQIQGLHIDSGSGSTGAGPNASASSSSSASDDGNGSSGGETGTGTNGGRNGYGIRSFKPLLAWRPHVKSNSNSNSGDAGSSAAAPAVASSKTVQAGAASSRLAPKPITTPALTGTLAMQASLLTPSNNERVDFSGSSPYTTAADAATTSRHSEYDDGSPASYVSRSDGIEGRGNGYLPAHAMTDDAYSQGPAASSATTHDLPTAFDLTRFQPGPINSITVCGNVVIVLSSTGLAAAYPLGGHRSPAIGSALKPASSSSAAARADGAADADSTMTKRMRSGSGSAVSSSAPFSSSSPSSSPSNDRRCNGSAAHDHNVALPLVFLNTSPTQLVHSVYCDRHAVPQMLYMSVSEPGGSDATLLQCFSVPCSALMNGYRGYVAALQECFGSEEMRYPGFVEFNSGNNMALTLSRQALAAPPATAAAAAASKSTHGSSSSLRSRDTINSHVAGARNTNPMRYRVWKLATAGAGAAQASQGRTAAASASETTIAAPVPIIDFPADSIADAKFNQGFLLSMHTGERGVVSMLQRASGVASGIKHAGSTATHVHMIPAPTVEMLRHLRGQPSVAPSTAAPAQAATASERVEVCYSAWHNCRPRPIERAAHVDPRLDGGEDRYYEDAAFRAAHAISIDSHDHGVPLQSSLASNQDMLTLTTMASQGSLIGVQLHSLTSGRVAASLLVKLVPGLSLVLIELFRGHLLLKQDTQPLRIIDVATGAARLVSELDFPTPFAQVFLSAACGLRGAENKRRRLNGVRSRSSSRSMGSMVPLISSRSHGSLPFRSPSYTSLVSGTPRSISSRSPSPSTSPRRILHDNKQQQYHEDSHLSVDQCNGPSILCVYADRVEVRSLTVGDDVAAAAARAAGNATAAPSSSAAADVASSTGGGHGAAASISNPSSTATIGSGSGRYTVLPAGTSLPIRSLLTGDDGKSVNTAMAGISQTGAHVQTSADESMLLMLAREPALPITASVAAAGAGVGAAAHLRQQQQMLAQGQAAGEGSSPLSASIRSANASSVMLCRVRRHERPLSSGGDAGMLLSKLNIAAAAAAATPTGPPHHHHHRYHSPLGGDVDRPAVAAAREALTATTSIRYHEGLGVLLTGTETGVAHMWSPLR